MPRDNYMVTNLDYREGAPLLSRLNNRIFFIFVGRYTFCHCLVFYADSQIYKEKRELCENPL